MAFSARSSTARPSPTMSTQVAGIEETPTASFDLQGVGIEARSNQIHQVRVMAHGSIPNPASRLSRYFQASPANASGTNSAAAAITRSVALPITIGMSGRTFGTSPQWSRCPWERMIASSDGSCSRAEKFAERVPVPPQPHRAAGRDRQQCGFPMPRSQRRCRRSASCRDGEPHVISALRASAEPARELSYDNDIRQHE